MKRVVAIDFGLKRIGIAVSDSGQKIAFPLETVAGGAGAVLNIKTALKGTDIEKILVGLPVLLNGKEGDMAGLVRTFAKNLEEAFHLPVELIDERFTSRMADQNLKEIHLNRKERTAKLDTAAAAILLQAYLDGKNEHFP
jgi:putative Holliday junction resolvase